MRVTFGGNREIGYAWFRLIVFVLEGAFCFECTQSYLIILLLCLPSTNTEI